MQSEQIYWTVENNTIGEAAPVTAEIQAKKHSRFPTRIKRYKVRKVEKDSTTHKSKIEGCLFLKRLVEQDKIKLKQNVNIELKNFIRATVLRQTYEYDDLVMSLVIAIRMIPLHRNIPRTCLRPNKQWIRC